MDTSEACNVPLCREKARDYDSIRESRNTGRVQARDLLSDIPEDVTEIIMELKTPISNILTCLLVGNLNNLCVLCSSSKSK